VHPHVRKHPRRQPTTADQIRAAQRETLRRLKRQAAAHPDSAIAEGVSDPWVRSLCDLAEAQIRDNTARWCPHLAGDSHPQPIHEVAWMPGRFACDRCVAAGVFVIPPPADRICDRCGVDTLGTGIYTGAAMAGLLTVDYGLCPACFGQVKATMGGGG